VTTSSSGSRVLAATAPACAKSFSLRGSLSAAFCGDGTTLAERDYDAPVDVPGLAPSGRLIGTTRLLTPLRAAVPVAI
jgi:hypothetical protein